jgi:hypothetical protein
MGARVYNPETNQFTSPDPVKGGNENSYTYPNDPINNSDFNGRWGFWADLAVNLLIGGLTAAACGVTAGLACPLIVGAVLVAVNGAASAAHDADMSGVKGKERDRQILNGAVSAVIINTVTLGVGKLVAGPVAKIATKLANSKLGSKVISSKLAKKFNFGKEKLTKVISKGLTKAVTKPVGKLTSTAIRALEGGNN